MSLKNINGWSNIPQEKQEKLLIVEKKARIKGAVIGLTFVFLFFGSLTVNTTINKVFLGNNVGFGLVSGLISGWFVGTYLARALKKAREWSDKEIRDIFNS